MKQNKWWEQKYDYAFSRIITIGFIAKAYNFVTMSLLTHTAVNTGALPMVKPITIQSAPAISITAEAFRPFGQLILPQPDDVAFNPQDAQLNLKGGTPRFYIMALHQRGRRFHTITRHGGCTQCLGSLEGQTWFLGVAPPGKASQPSPDEIKVFEIPGNCFVKLEVGTWHAGPYFDAKTVNFYNLELSDTNVVDHTTCDLLQTYGLEFEIV